MITIDQIKKYAELKERKFEVHYPHSKLYSFCKANEWCEWNAEANYSTVVGIELKKDVWYWWEQYDADDQCLHFRQRYNMANGAIQTTFRKGWKAEDEITDYLSKCE